ncbi:MAG: hypothetical protein RL701_1299 [Pseudomonadota bacterium]
MQAIAFYSLGDPEKSPLWERYAKVFVSGKGQAFGAPTQAAAVKQLATLRDTNISQVYFVGHGLDAKVRGKPCFMLSGAMRLAPKPDDPRHMIYSASSTNQLLEGADGPLVRALAPHLTLERQVLVAFLACHCGRDKVLQEGFARAVAKAEPSVDVRVEGYSSLYMIALSGSNNAFLASDDDRRLSIDYQAPERPISHLVVEAKSSVFIEPALPDPLSFMDSKNNDPLFGLEL